MTVLLEYYNLEEKIAMNYSSAIHTATVKHEIVLVLGGSTT